MSSLQPLTSPLDFRKAKHLLRRASWVYNKNHLDAFVGKTAAQAVDLLLTNPSDYFLPEPYNPATEAVTYGYWLSQDPILSGKGDQERSCITGWWFYNATRYATLRYKMSFFLHTSFTIEKRSGGRRPVQYYDYLRLLDLYALGNIKTLAKKVTLDVAMLDYLSNNDNTKNAPNENYAREFLELFTILKGDQIGDGDYTNYTETDVQAGARLLTGYGIDRSMQTIDPDTGLRCGMKVLRFHDTDDKVFSKAFDNQVITGRDTEAGMDQELDDYLDMIFNKQETARAYCRKLYRFFVKSTWTDEVDQNIIEPLSVILMDNNYEVVPVLKALLSSAHFYDADDGDPNDEIIGSIVKSPLQMMTEMISVFNLELPNPDPETGSDTESNDYYTKFIIKFLDASYFPGTGFNLFGPDSVAGYPAYYQQPGYDQLWFDSSTIIARYQLPVAMFKGRDIIGGRSNALIPYLDTVLFVDNTFTNASDPNLLIQDLTDLLYPESIDTDRVDYFKSNLIDEGNPDYYWTSAWVEYKNTGDDSVIRNRLESLFKAVINAPEFQLC